MDAEVLGTQLRQAGEGLGNLGAGHAVLGVAGVVHDLEALPGLSQGEHTAGIVAAADGLGHRADGLGQIVHQSQVVQVDDGAQLMGQLEFLGGRVVGGEHDVLAGDAAALGHGQLRQGGAVAAAALLLEKLQNGRGGGGLDGEVLPVAGIPGEGLPQAAGVFPDACFIVDMERSGVLGGNGLQLIPGDKWCFHKVTSNPSSCVGRGSARIWVLLYEDFALASRNFAAKRGKEGKIPGPAGRRKGTWKDGGDVVYCLLR